MKKCNYIKIQMHEVWIYKCIYIILNIEMKYRYLIMQYKGF